MAARAAPSRRPWYLHSGGRANTLAGDGRLDLDPPAGGEPADRYAYDPEDPVPTIGGNNSILTMTQGAETPILPGPRDQRVLERRDDVLCYTSRPLERDLEVIGPIEMVLYAASSARDTDFIVRLSDVYPNGKAIFLAEGILARALPRQRGGGERRAARAGRGRRVPDPLLPDGERLPARAPAPARRHELELPSLLAQPEHRRRRRHRDADRGRPAERPPHERLSRRTCSCP